MSVTSAGTAEVLIRATPDTHYGCSVDVAEPGKDGKPGETTRTAADLSLFDVREDVGETTNVAERNLEVVERMLALAEEARDELGDALTDR